MSAQLDAILAKAARPAIVADAVYHPSASSILSRQGGLFLARPGEGCPEFRGVRLVPILSIHTPELPYVPEFLKRHRYWAFFIQPGLHEQVTDDGSLVVRHYSDIGDLVPMLDCGSGAVNLQFRQVVDYPSRLALQGALANRPDLLEELDGRATDIEVRFPCHAGLKLAGYPHLIQGTAFLQTLEPDFQVQFDVCDTYTFADSGVGYVYSNLSAVIWESM